MSRPDSPHAACFPWSAAKRVVTVGCTIAIVSVMTSTVVFPNIVFGRAPLCCVAVFLWACATPPKPPVEDLSGRENLSSFTLAQLRGTRNGDRLDAEAMFEDGSSTLTVRHAFCNRNADQAAVRSMAADARQWSFESICA